MTTPHNTQDGSRREFLKSATATVLAATSCSHTLFAMTNDDDRYLDKQRNASVAGIFTVQFSQHPALRNVDGSVRIAVMGLPNNIIVTRASQTECTAVSETCTHNGCPINTFNAANQRFVCDCHGSEFDVRGVRTGGPARANLRSFRTIFTAGSDFVQVDIPEFMATSVHNGSVGSSALGQAYPNPASGVMHIEYALAEPCTVTITLYSILGKELMQLLHKHQSSGQYRLTHDVSGLGNGVYLYRMVTSTGFSQTRKITIAE